MDFRECVGRGKWKREKKEEGERERERDVVIAQTLCVAFSKDIKIMFLTSTLTPFQRLSRTNVSQRGLWKETPGRFLSGHQARM